jgi:hypothetical protein
MRKKNVLGIAYNEVADYLFDSLLDLGYAPEGDEILDLADMFCGLLVACLEQSGKTAVIIEDMED